MRDTVDPEVWGGLDVVEFEQFDERFFEDSAIIFYSFMAGVIRVDGNRYNDGDSQIIDIRVVDGTIEIHRTRRRLSDHLGETTAMRTTLIIEVPQAAVSGEMEVQTVIHARGVRWPSWIDWIWSW